MKYPKKLASFFLWLWSAQSMSQTIEGPSIKYTFDSLKTFWDNNIGYSDNSALYQGILGSQDNHDAPPGNPGDRPRQIPVGVDEDNPQVAYVDPIPSSANGPLARREISLHMYLGKVDQYQEEEFIEDDARDENRPRLARLKNFLSYSKKLATLEMFLIKFIRYRAAGDPRLKCSYVKDSDYYRDLSVAISIYLSGSGTSQQLPDFYRLTPLIDSLSSVQNSVEGNPLFLADLNDHRICNLRDLRNRTVITTNMKVAVNSKIMTSLEEMSTSTLSAIEESRGNIDALKGAVEDLDPGVSDLLRLEEELTNAGSTITLIGSDMFGLDAKVSSLNAVDIATIQNIDIMPETLVAAKTAKEDLIAKLGLMIDTLETQAGSYVQGSECAGLNASLGSLMADIQSNRRVPPLDSFLSQVSACIEAFRLKVAEKAVTHPDTAIANEFSDDLIQLNTAITNSYQ